MTPKKTRQQNSEKVFAWNVPRRIGYCTWWQSFEYSVYVLFLSGFLFSLVGGFFCRALFARRLGSCIVSYFVCVFRFYAFYGSGIIRCYPYLSVYSPVSICDYSDSCYSIRFMLCHTHAHETDAVPSFSSVYAHFSAVSFYQMQIILFVEAFVYLIKFSPPEYTSRFVMCRT